MPNDENLHNLEVLEEILPILEEIVKNITQQLGKTLAEWGDEEWDEFWNKFERQLLYMVEWVKKYLKKHPCEDCILEALLLECEKIKVAQREVMNFVEAVKQEVELNQLGGLIPLAEETEERLKFLLPMYKGVFQILNTFYPNITDLKMIVKSVYDTEARTIETAFKKGIKKVIAVAASETFQHHITECQKQVEEHRENMCLCFVIQALRDSDLNHKSIGIILNKQPNTITQLHRRCQEYRTTWS